MKRLLLAGLTACAMGWGLMSTAAATGTASPDSGIHVSTLANGLTLVVKPDRRAPTAVHMLWVRVGSMDEVDGHSGLAHVLEHMLFKGTPRVPAGEFSRRVAAMGGRENAFTSRDYTGYFQMIPANRLADVMQLEADRFAHNRWPDHEFRKELEVVKEERRLRTEDSPRALLMEQLGAVQFTASPYRRPIVGWMSDLDAMTPDDARDFYRRWYTPSNAVVVVVGDVEPQAVRRLAEKAYGSIPARAVPARKPNAEPPQLGQRRLEVKAPAEQAYLMMSWKVPGFQGFNDSAESRDALALTVLSAVLDGYGGARLDRHLTQGADRLADGAGAYHDFSGRGPSVFVLDGVPAAGKTPQALEAALRAQVDRIAREGVSEDELRRVKAQWVAQAVYKRDSVFNQAREIGTYWIEGLPLDTSDRLIERLRAVTAEQVQSVAQRYFGNDTLTVGTLLPQPRDPAAVRKPATPIRH